MEEKYWKVKSKVIKANSYSDMRNAVLNLFSTIEKRSKRKPYIRSKYFKKQKIFLHFFWTHLFEKNPKDRVRRMKFFSCAIELLEKSTYPPGVTRPTRKDALMWYRFYGETEYKERFVVQIKESKNGNKYLMSMFQQK